MVSCFKAWLVLGNTFLWVAAVCAVACSLLLYVDPRRNYLLELVNYAESDQLLLVAVLMTIISAIFVLISASGGCCCLLSTRPLGLIGFYVAVLSAALVVHICGLGLIFAYQSQINSNADGYFYDLVHRRYGRENWVTSLVDTIQFYQKCCGANGSRDYLLSYWQINDSPGTMYYVPVSCCTQRDDAQPPHQLAPIDDRCREFPYDRQLASAVHQQGCVRLLQRWLRDNTLLLAFFVIFLSLIETVQILSTCVFYCRQKNVLRRNTVYRNLFHNFQQQ